MGTAEVKLSNNNPNQLSGVPGKTGKKLPMIPTIIQIRPTDNNIESIKINFSTFGTYKMLGHKCNLNNSSLYF